MLDSFNREINYLRISVTDRCNLRCVYCMPEEGIKLISHNDVLSLEEIADIAKVAATKFGITKIRLTGGEPLVRKGIVDLVKMLKAIHEVKEITLTTNGILLPKYAKPLKEAGLNRVNISLDTLSPKDYKRITRIGNVEDVIKGIDAAKEANLYPIKINVVRTQNGSEETYQQLRDFCNKKGLQIRFIQEMNLEEGTFSQVEGGDGGNCAICNRLRLTANGYIKPCLFSNKGYNVRELGTEKAFELAVKNKPKKGVISNNHQFYNIGG